MTVLRAGISKRFQNEKSHYYGCLVISFRSFAFSLLVEFEDWNTLIFMSLFSKLMLHIAVLKLNESEHYYLVLKKYQVAC